MKAIEILKGNRQLLLRTTHGFYLDEAIAELEVMEEEITVVKSNYNILQKQFDSLYEALQVPKTCDGCMYVINCFIIDSLNARMDTAGFCCNRYEAKQ